MPFLWWRAELSAALSQSTRSVVMRASVALALIALLVCLAPGGVDARKKKKKGKKYGDLEIRPHPEAADAEKAARQLYPDCGLSTS